MAVSFFLLGATTFGGMFAGAMRLEEELVNRRRWLTSGEMAMMLVVATLIPAPRFLGLGAVVGHRLRGWPGSALASMSLVAPSALIILAAVVFISPAMLAGPLAVLKRVVALAAVGIIFGTVFRLLLSARKECKPISVKGFSFPAGYPLALAVAAGMFLGVPIWLVVLGGLAVAYVVGEPSGENRS